MQSRTRLENGILSFQCLGLPQGSETEIIIDYYKSEKILQFTLYSLYFPQYNATPISFNILQLDVNKEMDISSSLSFSQIYGSSNIKHELFLTKSNWGLYLSQLNSVVKLAYKANNMTRSVQTIQLWARFYHKQTLTTFTNKIKDITVSILAANFTYDKFLLIPMKRDPLSFNDNYKVNVNQIQYEITVSANYRSPKFYCERVNTPGIIGNELNVNRIYQWTIAFTDFITNAPKTITPSISYSNAIKNYMAFDFIPTELISLNALVTCRDTTLNRQKQLQIKLWIDTTKPMFNQSSFTFYKNTYVKTDIEWKNCRQSPITDNVFVSKMPQTQYNNHGLPLFTKLRFENNKCITTLIWDLYLSTRATTANETIIFKYLLLRSDYNIPNNDQQLFITVITNQVPTIKPSYQHNKICNFGVENVQRILSTDVSDTDTGDYINDYIIIQQPWVPVEQKIQFTSITITPTPNNPFSQTINSVLNRELILKFTPQFSATRSIGVHLSTETIQIIPVDSRGARGNPYSYHLVCVFYNIKLAGILHTDPLITSYNAHYGQNFQMRFYPWMYKENTAIWIQKNYGWRFQFQLKTAGLTVQPLPQFGMWQLQDYNSAYIANVTYSQSVPEINTTQTVVYTLNVFQAFYDTTTQMLQHDISVTIHPNIIPTFDVPSVENRFIQFNQINTFTLNPNCATNNLWSFNQNMPANAISFNSNILRIDGTLFAWEQRHLFKQFQVTLTCISHTQFKFTITQVFPLQVHYNVQWGVLGTNNVLSVSCTEELYIRPIILSKHHYEELSWSLESQTPNYGSDRLQSWTINQQGQLSFTPNAFFGNLEQQIVIQAIDITYPDAHLHSNNTYTIIVRFLSSNLPPWVRICNSDYPNCTDIVDSETDNSLENVKPYTSKAQIQAIDYEESVLTFSIIQPKDTQITNIGLIVTQETGVFTPLQNLQPIPIKIWKAKITWNDVSDTYTSGLFKIKVSNTRGLQTIKQFFFYDIKETSLPTTLINLTKCPIVVDYKQIWKCQILLTPSLKHLNSQITISLSKTSSTGTCNNQTYLYGKGYYEWKETNFACKNVNWRVQITKTRSDGTTISCFKSFVLTVRFVNTPPSVVVSTRLLSIDGSPNNEYFINFKLFDQERNTFVKQSCISDIQDQFQVFDQDFSLISYTANLPGETEESTIKWVHKKQYSTSWSGNIKCTLIETNGGPAVFGGPPVNFQVSFEFAICITPTCSFNPVIYNIESANCLVAVDQVSDKMQLKQCKQNSDGNIRLKIMANTIDTPEVYVGNKKVKSSISKSYSNGITTLEFDVENLAGQWIDLTIFNDCSEEVYCQKYSYQYSFALSFDSSYNYNIEMTRENYTSLLIGNYHNWVPITFTSSQSGSLARFQNKNYCLLAFGSNYLKGHFHMMSDTQGWCFFEQFTSAQESYANTQNVVSLMIRADNDIQQTNQLLIEAFQPINLSLDSESTYQFNKIDPAVGGHKLGNYDLQYTIIINPKQNQPMNQMLGYFSDLQTRIYVLFNDRYLFTVDRRHHSTISTKLLIRIPPYIDNERIYQNATDEVRIKIGYGKANKFKYSVNLKTDLTLNCPKGYYCDGYGLQKECDKGFECPRILNLGMPLPCKPGFYNDKVKQTSCIQCDRFHICTNETTIKVPQRCPGGWYCDDVQLAYLTTVHECPPGYICQYNLTHNYTTPTNRDLITRKFSEYKHFTGFEQSADLDEFFTPWEITTSSSLLGQVSVVTPNDTLIDRFFMNKYGVYMCSSNYFCNRRVRYINKTNSIGKEFTIEGYEEIMAPLKCLPTFQCNDHEAYRWGQGFCEAGYYCPEAPPLLPFTCMNSTCKCELGHYCPKGSKVPMPCPPGTYNNITQQESCKACPITKYCQDYKTVDQNECPKGRFCPDQAMKQPVDCEIGYWNNLINQAACFICPAGKICKQKATEIPEPCPLGWVCLEGNAFPCPVGYFCELGTQYNYDEPLCEAMKMYITSENNIHKCPIDCPVGYFCPTQSSVMTPCEIGTYQDERTQGLCKTCKRGYYCNQPNISDLTPFQCERGYICNKTGIFSMGDICPGGYYCLKNTDGSLEDIGKIGVTQTPLLCPKGFYCNEGTGYPTYDLQFPSMSPIPCADNTYADEEGLVRCKTCQSGFQCPMKIQIYNQETYPLIGTITPVPCGKGKVRDTKSPNILCYDCQIGTYRDDFEGTSQSDCLPCPAGKLCMLAGAFNTTIGTDNPQITMCPAGFYCIPGTYIDILQSSSCPERFACVPGLKGLKDVYKYPCPKGRMCKEGSGSSLEIYQLCKQNPQLQLCTVGELCTNDYFCEENSAGAEESNKCPRGTKSSLGSYQLEMCLSDIFQFQDSQRLEYTEFQKQTKILMEYSDYNRLKITNLPTFGIIQFTFDLSSMPNAPYDSTKTYNIPVPAPGQLLRVATVEEDYRLVLNNAYANEDNYDQTDNQFSELFLIGQTGYNYKPLSLPSIPNIFFKQFFCNSDASHNITFRILANKPFYFNNDLREALMPYLNIYNGYYSHRSFDNVYRDVLKFDFNIQSTDKSYIFFWKKVVTTEFDAPTNILTYQNRKTQQRTIIFNLMASIIVTDWTSYYQLYYTNYNEIKENPLLIENSDLQFIAWQYIPYITDCDNYGSFVPFWEIIKFQSNDPNNNCILVPENDRTTIEPFFPMQQPVSDNCTIILKCRFGDNIFNNQNALRLWFKSTELNKNFLYMISKQKLVPSEFEKYLPGPKQYSYKGTINDLPNTINIESKIASDNTFALSGQSNSVNIQYAKQISILNYTSSNQIQIPSFYSIQYGINYFLKYFQSLNYQIKYLDINIKQFSKKNYFCIIFQLFPQKTIFFIKIILQIPTNITLSVGYYTRTQRNLDVLWSYYLFANFISLDDANQKRKFQMDPFYNLYLKYYPLKWIQCLDYFGFDEFFYYGFIFTLIMLILCIISAFWYRYYKFSKIIPRPEIQIGIYFQYSLKSLTGLSYGFAPLFSGIFFLDVMSRQLDIFSKQGRGDYRNSFSEKTASEIEITRIGRFAVSLFTIGLYAMKKGVQLLLPDIRKADLKVKRKSEYEKVVLDNSRKRAYLYFSTMMGVAFASTFYQFSKSSYFKGSTQGIAIFVYNQFAGKVLTIARAGFRDELMVLPLSGSFSLILLTISMKIDLFQVFAQGYVIATMIKVFKRLIVAPNMITIENIQADVMAYYGQKSAQNNKLGMTLTRRIFQEQLNDLGQSSGEFLAAWIFPIIMIFQQFFYAELNIKISKQFLSYFVIFTFLQASAEIIYTIFLNNGVECSTGRKLSGLIEECTDVFTSRKTLWCLSDKQPIASYFSKVPESAKSLQKMGFSAQFFFLNTLYIMGLIIQVYSIEFWVIKGYHPLRDTSFIIILAGSMLYIILSFYQYKLINLQLREYAFILRISFIQNNYIINLAWIFSMVVEEFIKTGGKLGKLWVVDLKKQALIFETKTQLNSQSSEIQQKIMNIFNNLPDSLKEQERKVTVNYILSELLLETYNDSNALELKNINLMEVMKYLESVIDQEQAQKNNDDDDDQINQAKDQGEEQSKVKKNQYIKTKDRKQHMIKLKQIKNEQIKQAIQSSSFKGWANEIIIDWNNFLKQYQYNEKIPVEDQQIINAKKNKKAKYSSVNSSKFKSESQMKKQSAMQASIKSANTNKTTKSYLEEQADIKKIIQNQKKLEENIRKNQDKLNFF